MFLPVLQSNPTSWQGQTTKLCTTWPPESRQPAWLHQSSSALYSPPTLATTTLDFPISRPRISPSAKSAAPSRTLIQAIGTRQFTPKACMFLPMASVDRLAAVRALRDISLLLQLKGENAFRCRAYEVGADRLAGLSEDLGTLVAQGKLEDLPGIGPALAEKITELATTGRIHFLDELRADFPPRILELMKLPELGPKKVAALWRELQIGDIEELETACRAQRVRSIRGFGPRTEEKILSGIAL